MRTREKGMEDRIMLGSSRCDDRSAQRTDPTCSAARNRIRALALRLRVSAVILLASLCGLRAQSYSIDWFTIDGGGGTSTGGVYQVSGTVGQPDAGPTMSSGIYSVDGGFWGIIAAVQTPGAPLLTIVRTTTNTVAISWPSPSTGWTLQQNTNSVASVNWSDAPGTIQDNGVVKSLVVNPPAGNRFYRLFKP